MFVFGFLPKVAVLVPSGRANGLALGFPSEYRDVFQGHLRSRKRHLTRSLNFCRASAFSNSLMVAQLGMAWCSRDRTLDPGTGFPRTVKHPAIGRGAFFPQPRDILVT